MKKVLLLFCLITIMFSAKAQVWAPVGATWHYTINDAWGFVGYMEIKSIGDTVVLGKTCKILSKTIVGEDLSLTNPNIDTTNWGHEYTYIDSNNVVYYYRFGQFFTLYNFNANPSDYWTIAGDENSIPVANGCDSVSQTVVASASTTTINSFSLKTLEMSFSNSDVWLLGTSITERIGTTSGYMFPEYAGGNCGIVTEEWNYTFRCYYDSTFGLYESGVASSCDYITGIKDIALNENLVKIYPNPSSSELNIEMENFSNSNYSVEIYSRIGQKLSSRKMNEKLISLSTDNLANGSYLVLVRKENGAVGFSKLVEVSHN